MVASIRVFVFSTRPWQWQGGKSGLQECVNTGIGVFTIVAEADGERATKWGKLKSGAGWISLDYVKKN